MRKKFPTQVHQAPASEHGRRDSTSQPGGPQPQHRTGEKIIEGPGGASILPAPSNEKPNSRK